MTYYFSTHGCRREVSFAAAAAFDELDAPFVAVCSLAAAARALLEKKFAAMDRSASEGKCVCFKRERRMRAFVEK